MFKNKKGFLIVLMVLTILTSFLFISLLFWTYSYAYEINEFGDGFYVLFGLLTFLLLISLVEFGVLLYSYKKISYSKREESIKY